MVHVVVITKSDFIPATKRTISSFSTSDMLVLSTLCRKLYPELFSSERDVTVPQSYRKMLSATVKGQKMKSGQYVGARPVVPYPGPSTTKSFFSDSDIRPAKVLFFSLCHSSG